MEQTSYISQLNLEESPLSSIESTNDLSSFTDSSFFDFDQFSNQYPLKQETENIISEIKLDEFTSDGFTYLENFVKDNVVSFAPVEQPKLAQASTPVEGNQVTILSTADKKKRNTAASARFRVKKKLKEEEMERTLRDLNERVTKYNLRIQQLEMENSCLKSLIVQKNEQRSNALVQSIKEKSLSPST